MLFDRWENNGWRPISDKLLYAADPIATESAAKRIPTFHHSRLIRQQDAMRRRKQKKLTWLQKVYGLKQAGGKYVHSVDVLRLRVQWRQDMMEAS